ncbi:hypothetical protein BDN72DRAFT_742666, partial [Pluteus cervinus]
AIEVAKREYFDEVISVISNERKRPWDLTSWGKPRRKPMTAVLNHNGVVCDTDTKMWDAFDASFHSATNRPVDMGAIPGSVTSPDVPFMEVTDEEIINAISGTSSSSAPGLDRITW